MRRQRRQSRKMSEVVLKNVKKIYPNTASDSKKKKKAKKGEETHEGTR